MIFLTAIALGMTTVALRSTFCIILVCLMIVGTFTAAAFMSAGPVHFMSLFYAIAGYNIGVVNVVVGLLIVQRFSRSETTLSR